MSGNYVAIPVNLNAPLIPIALLRAAVGIQPERALFRDTFVDGRRLGDIDNTGTVSSADSFAYLSWAAGTLPVGAQKTYIETVFNPYLAANPVTYAAYLTQPNWVQVADAQSPSWADVSTS